jgi:HAD superfamily hydrolase (TIGR01509 family)
MVTNVQKRHGFTLSPEELETYVLMEEDRVIATLERKAEPCIGATEGLEKLHETGKYGMAVVSSSARRRVKASIKKVGQDKFFPDDHIFSAATSLEKPTSKPDPAIYMHACKVLNKQPCECIAVEDSKSGTLSAVRAGIPVLGYVGCYDNEEQTEMRKLLADTGAWVIMNEWHEIMECLVEMERLAAEKQAAEKQATEKQATEKQATENQATEKQATEKLC